MLIPGVVLTQGTVLCGGMGEISGMEEAVPGPRAKSFHIISQVHRHTSRESKNSVHNTSCQIKSLCRQDVPNTSCQIKTAGLLLTCPGHPKPSCPGGAESGTRLERRSAPAGELEGGPPEWCVRWV